MKEYTNFGEFSKALELWQFSHFAGEEVVVATPYSEPGASPFLPRKQGYELQTVSGKIIKCTNKEKTEIKAPDALIKYTGTKHDQFESGQGYYH